MLLHMTLGNLGLLYVRRDDVPKKDRAISRKDRSPVLSRVHGIVDRELLNFTLCH